jgi:hypothetical protein
LLQARHGEPFDCLLARTAWDNAVITPHMNLAVGISRNNTYSTRQMSRLLRFCANTVDLHMITDRTCRRMATGGLSSGCASKHRHGATGSPGGDGWSNIDNMFGERMSQLF